MSGSVTDPLRAVTRAVLRGGVVGINSGFRGRWWEMTLECGHEAERTVRYQKGASEGRRGFARLHHQPPASKILPAPKRVRCWQCRPHRQTLD